MDTDRRVEAVQDENEQNTNHLNNIIEDKSRENRKLKDEVQKCRQRMVSVKRKIEMHFDTWFLLLSSLVFSLFLNAHIKIK